MITKYFTNGSLDDEKLVGLTLAKFTFTDDGEPDGVQMSNGKPYFGYKAEEISKEKFDELAALIADPTDSKYELGIFKNGLLNAKTHKKMEALRSKENDAYLERKAQALEPAWQRAVRLAKASGGTPREVLQDFRPDIPANILDKLEQNHK
jgi:hypothetical protein